MKKLTRALTAAICLMSYSLSAKADDSEPQQDYYSFSESLRSELPNFIHPKFSDLACVFRTENFTDGTHRVGTMSIVSASLNKGGALEFSGGYYLTRNMLFGLDVAARPVRNLTVRVGIQKLPYILEANANLATHPFFGFSQQVSYLGGYSDLTGMSTRGKDFGYTLEGSLFQRDGYAVVNYIAGIFNGAGVQFKDTDTKKDFSGRLIIQPSKDWKFSAGALVGYYTPLDEDAPDTPDDNLPDVDEDMEGPIVHNAGPRVKKRYSGGVHYDHNGWFMKFEDVFGITDQLRSNGISTYFGKQINDENTIALKYDHFKKDMDVNDSCSTKAGIGFSHSFGGGVTSKIQYDHTSYSNVEMKSVNSVSICLMFSFSTQL